MAKQVPSHYLLWQHKYFAGVFKPESGCILINNVPSFDNEEIKKEVLFISDSPYSNINTNIESLITFYSSFYFVDRIRLGNYLDLFEVNEQEFLAHPGNISYSRSTVRENGVSQIELTKGLKV